MPKRKDARETRRANKRRAISKWSPQTRAKILAALREGVFRYNAAAIAHVGESTLRRWIAKGHEELAEWEEWAEARDDGEELGPEPKVTAWGYFALDVAEAEGIAEANAIKSILRAGLGRSADPNVEGDVGVPGEWRALAWFLERKQPRRYGSYATRGDTPVEGEVGDDGVADAEAMIIESVAIVQSRISRAKGGGEG